MLTAMSLCMDLPDSDYEWVQLSGAWARERHVKVRKLEQGIQAVDSMRGIPLMNTILYCFKTTCRR